MWVSKEFREPLRQKHEKNKEEKSLKYLFYCLNKLTFPSLLLFVFWLLKHSYKASLILNFVSNFEKNESRVKF